MLVNITPLIFHASVRIRLIVKEVSCDFNHGHYQDMVDDLKGSWNDTS